MALSSRDNNTQIRKYYTGLETFKVIAFNPSGEQLKEIYNLEVAEDPQYITESDGKQRVRLSFHLDNENESNRIKQRAEFYLTNEFSISKTGKVQVCNAYGKFTWITEDMVIPESMASWFKNEGVRKAYKGEEELVRFLWARLNVRSDQGDQIQLEKISSLFSGDFTEISNALNANPDNKVMFALGVKKSEGDNGTKYTQVVYSRNTMKPTNNTQVIESLDKSIRDFKQNGGAANVYFGGMPFKFTEVIPSELNFENVPTDSPNIISNTSVF